ncbi:MAG: sodium:solute symporter family protein [Sphaerochaetaceae bacterium]|nr:sodium:solute symporter family protein [Sphaerochaetaceae bacterium]
MSFSVVVAIGLYFILMLAIGYFSSKRVDAEEDFSIAGRRLSPLLLACSIAATELGIGSTLGVFEKAFGDWGLSAAWYILAMVFAFIIISVFAPKFRKTEVKTIPEYFRRRYGKKSGLISAIIMIIPLIIFVVIQFVAAGTILSILLGIDYKITVSIIAFIVISYTLLGGMWGVAISDFIQSIFIIIGLILVSIYTLRLCNNFPNVVKHVPYESLNLYKGLDTPKIISLVIMYVATFTVGQEVAVNFFSINHSYDSTKGTIFTAFLLLVFAFVPTLLGLMLFSLTKLGYIDTSVVFVDGLRYSLLHLALNAMPPFLIGTLFLSLLSATMSSADSDILAVGSIFSNDIYNVYFDNKASSKQLIFISRLSIAMFGFVAYLLALFNSGSILAILIFVFSLRAAGAFIPYVFGLYWAKSSAQGSIAAMIVGSLSFIIFKILNIKIFDLEPLILSLLISFVAFITFSKLFPPAVETLELSD